MLELSLRTGLLPVTRGAFGANGMGTIVGQFTGATVRGRPLGSCLTNRGETWFHPALFDGTPRPRGLCTYELSLDRRDVVMRRHETSALSDDRVWRAPPLEVEHFAVETLAGHIAALAAQGGVCARRNECARGIDAPAIAWREGVFVDLVRNGHEYHVICGACHDALSVVDLRLRDETILDGRRIVPNAGFPVLLRT